MFNQLADIRIIKLKVLGKPEGIKTGSQGLIKYM
jgi:hypothetical protein